MTTTVQAPRTPKAAATHIGPAILALAMGGFGIGITEFAMMGLLKEMEEGLGISTPEAGHLISAYALGVVVGAPVSLPSARNFRASTLRWASCCSSASPT